MGVTDAFASPGPLSTKFAFKSHIMDFSMLDLNSPVRYLKGVGPKKAEFLSNLGIHNLEDLILHPPRTWEDRRLNAKAPSATEPTAHFVQILDVKENIIAHAKLAIYKAQARISQTNQKLHLTWIRRLSTRWDVLLPLRRAVRPGNFLLVFGKKSNDSLNATPEFEIHDWLQLENGNLPQDSPCWNRLTPVYSATDGLSQKELRELRWKTLPSWQIESPSLSWETLGLGINTQLLNLKEAYQAIHFPRDEAELELARRSLALWEFFLLSLAMELRKQSTKRLTKPHRYADASHPRSFTELLKRLQITLTNGQKQAIEDILLDMQNPHPMNRLLQGEVGSGKTLVAVAAILKAIEAGYQVAFLAPTEVLVFQHSLTVKNYLEQFSIPSAMLTSELPAKKREELLAGIKEGTIPLALGTHALLSHEVEFKKLALVIIDEQHRFGVDQRWQIRSKTQRPDSLVLSATPIPRTLALALYGDLDISTIEELPVGHFLPNTILLREESSAWEMARKELERGSQIYVAVPTIEDEKTSFYNIKKAHEKISKIFPANDIVVLHGKLRSQEKEKSFQAFREGKVKIMLATTIIEVGVDVPAANTIVILGAEHFGLATLHQLRGRISRSHSPGLCLLVPSADFALWKENFWDPTLASKRLELFAKSKGGFEIGELDLKLRGPGELVGFQQHGDLNFRHFNFDNHISLIAPAKELARKIVETDPQLKKFSLLRHELEKSFGTKFLNSDLS